MSNRTAAYLAGILIALGTAPALTAQTYTAEFEFPVFTSSWTENGHNFVLSDGDIRDYNGTARSGTSCWLVREEGDEISIDQVIDPQSLYINPDFSVEITFTGYIGFTEIATKSVNFSGFGYEQVTFGSGWEGIDRIELWYPSGDFVSVFADDFSYSLAALPVELTAFSALADGSTALLTWQTASETNNAGFEVEYWTRETWQQLGFVEGMGTTNTPQSYAYRTSDLDPGRHVFRLRQVDLTVPLTTAPKLR